MGRGKTPDHTANQCSCSSVRHHKRGGRYPHPPQRGAGSNKCIESEYDEQESSQDPGRFSSTDRSDGIQYLLWDGVRYLSFR